MLAGCAPDDQRTADRADTSRLAPATADRDAAPKLLVPNGTIPTRSGQLRVERLAALEEPWGMAFLPDGRLLITEKPGRLRIFHQGKLSAAVEGVPAVVYFGQGGLLDVAVDPDFAKNQFVYLSYTEAATPQPPGVKETKEPRLGAFQRMEDQVLSGSAVARGRLDGGSLRDVRVIWRQVPKTVGRGHFGGRLAFAPDSTLFIASSERMRFDPAQDLASNLGKIVRIRGDGSVPLDNPFVADSGARPEIWSMGHRNPSGLAFQPGSGRLWSVEFGPKGGDELNLIQKGRNYGWPLVNEGVNYDDSPIPHHATRPDFVRFVRSWTPVISPGSMMFYTGSQFPQWQGNILIAGLSSQSIIRLTLDGDRVSEEEVIAMGRRIRNLAQARDGSLLALSESPNAELLRLSPAP
ncbi:MAG: PQQ-dependent sugar dehydrogenase [Gemmatimonadaceae bacterium]|nr:PQQ-dependent sugar dehydrogenase [Gemmatimonadaceae bacterium]